MSIIKELPKTRRAQKRFKAFVWWSWCLTIGVCIATSHASEGKPALPQLIVMVLATVAAYRLTKRNN